MDQSQINKVVNFYLKSYQPNLLKISFKIFPFKSFDVIAVSHWLFFKVSLMLGHCCIVLVGLSDQGCHFLLREVQVIGVENFLEFLGHFLSDLLLFLVMMEND